jgi:hypothetical protein
MYFINAENFDAAGLKKFLGERGCGIISELPLNPVSVDKGIVVINCKIQINKAPDGNEKSRDWISDLVLSDAFNEHTVLYSKTSAGDENGADGNDAASKASASAEAEMNRMAREFFNNK